jgi:hypothetical protein
MSRSATRTVLDGAAAPAATAEVQTRASAARQLRIFDFIDASSGSSDLLRQ